MTENVRKLVGVVAIAALVVVGVVTTSGGDDVDFTRNAAFTKLPAAQRARLAPAFVQQAAPKAIDTGRLEKTGLIWFTPKPNVTESTGAGNTDKAGIWLQSGGTDALGTGKASVLEGRGVDGKGGTSSYRAGTGVNGKTGKAFMVTIPSDALSGRKASFRAGGGMNGVADRILQCASGGIEEMKERAAPSIIAIMISLFSGDVKDEGCNIANLNQKSEQLTNDDDKVGSWVVNGNPFREHEPLALAECMESKVDGVFLTSHIKAKAADCVATVMPALLPDRAKRLGTYWQTPEQLTRVTAGPGETQQ